MGLINQEVLLSRALPGLFDDGRRGGNVAIAAAVEVLRGRKAVAARRDLLVNLCRRTGQAGAMDTLEVCLDHPSSRAKTPYLILVGPREATDWDAGAANDLDGAVLLYEYRIAGCGTGVFATDDITGERTVIAPRPVRTEVAQLACHKLLERGAQTVMITLEGKADAGSDAWPQSASVSPCRIAARERKVPRYLPLGKTLDQTLARLGRHTRRNLRYYRRRLESEIGATFVPDVAMPKEEFFEFNRRSTHPAPEAHVAWRYNAIQQTPDTMFAGVKSSDGRWLSLIGGRRRSRLTEIQWQMNLGHLSRYSLSTVMRSYVLEHEVQLGTTQLVFVGGTPHSLRHSFVCSDAVDLIAQRRSLNALLLRRFSRWIFPQTNFLGHTLRDQDLRWIDC
jgi:hypothetical protein